jgi:hypothetical protein
MKELDQAQQTVLQIAQTMVGTEEMHPIQIVVGMEELDRTQQTAQTVVEIEGLVRTQQTARRIHQTVARAEELEQTQQLTLLTAQIAQAVVGMEELEQTQWTIPQISQTKVLPMVMMSPTLTIALPQKMTIPHRKKRLPKEMITLLHRTTMMQVRTQKMKEVRTRMPRKMR